MSTLASPALYDLPDPTIIEPLDYEILFEEIKGELIKLAPDLKEALNFESEPATKMAELIAYRILHERKLANDKALSLMLAKGYGAQLDNLGALPFLRTPRKVLEEAREDEIPPVPAVLESDDEYRTRLQIALEGFSTAGPVGAYIYHGLAAHEDIKDISVDAPTFTRFPPAGDVAANLPDNAIILTPEYNAGLEYPMPGDVAISVLSRQGDGSVSDEVLVALDEKLNREDVRPLTDRPRYRSAEIVPYSVQANVWFYPGPDSGLVMEEAYSKTLKYTEDNHRIGHDITLSGLHAAIHRPGVQRVELIEPAQNIVINNHQAAYCTGIDIQKAGEAL